MLNKKEISYPCGYCEYFKLVEYEKDYPFIQKGICQKHDQLRHPYDKLCDDFVLKLGIHTEKWYPKKP